MAYVYGLFYEDSKGFEQCFYIGKGTGRRMEKHFYDSVKKENNNPHKTRTIDKYDCYPKVIVDGLSDEQAYELEALLLSDDYIHGQLTNISREATGYPSGEDHPMYGQAAPTRLLDEENVACIKWLLQHTEIPGTAMAEWHDVHSSTIYNIKRGHSFQDVAPSTPEWYSQKKENEIVRKRDEMRAKAISKARTGTTYSEEYKKQCSERSSGEGNPMYGVDGEDAPAYGKTGEDCPNHKYTNREIGYAAWLTENGWQKTEIDDLLGVGRSTMHHVENGGLERDTSPIQPPKYVLDAATAYLREELSTAIRVFRLHAQGLANTTIAERMGMSSSANARNMLVRQQTRIHRNFALLLDPDTIRRLISMEDGDMNHPYAKSYISSIDDLLPQQS